MYVVTVSFTVHPEHLEAFKAAVLEQAQASLEREASCKVFDVCVDSERPGTIFLYEKYSTPEAFAAHLESAHFLHFDKRVRPWITDKKVLTWRELGR